MKNVAYKVIGDFLLACYNEQSPSEQEGREILAVFKTLDLDRIRMLTFTKGGAPTPTQRKAFVDVLQGKEIPTAVISDALLVRGAVTALSWFNKRIKAFTPEHLEDAFAYLEIPPSQYALFKREAIRLEAELTRPVNRR